MSIRNLAPLAIVVLLSSACAQMSASVGYGTAYGPEWGTARGTTFSREQYDLLTLNFRNDGVLASWRLYAQR